MSKKRTPTESSNDGQTNKGPDCELMQAVFQHEDNTKRAKLTSLSDTTLQDLPIELLECILVKVVAMEVKAMKLAKRAWKEKADLVVKRLKTVSVQWSSILTTNCFRTKLHRALDDTDEEKIRLELVDQVVVNAFVLRMSTFGNEVFTLTRNDGGGHEVHVYNLNNMAEVKDVIALPLEYCPLDMPACNVSNCVYILCESYTLFGPVKSVIKLARDANDEFTIEPLIVELMDDIFSISVSPDGHIVVFSFREANGTTVLNTFDVYGVFQHQKLLSTERFTFNYGDEIIHKSYGNLMVISTSDTFDTFIVEFDPSGMIVRQFKSVLDPDVCVNVVDTYGRVLLMNNSNVEFLDSELNTLAGCNIPPNIGRFDLFELNSERNEIIAISYGALDRSTVSVLRLREM